MKVLFLDDRQERIDVAKERYKDDELTIVRTVEEAIAELSKEQAWHLLCLDHDLGGESFVDPSRDDCGMEIIRYLTTSTGLLEMKRQDPFIVIHSSNLHAALEMYAQLKNFGYRVTYERFRYD